MGIKPCYFLIAALCLGSNSANQSLQKNGEQVKKTSFTHVIAAETEYYTTGPQQSRPPDGKFSAGLKVNIVEEAGSYVRVRSEGGVEAYVASDSVKQQEYNAMDVSGIVDGGNQFALDLYQRLRSDDGNLFYSPSSISTALAMTYAGAAGETESEMAKTLHFQMPKDQLHQGMHALQAYWKTPDKKKGIRLNLANRLWGQDRYEFLPAFLGITREMYGAELARLNFAQTEQARQSINSWVEGQTENKIADLLPVGSIKSDTRLVLTNAVEVNEEGTEAAAATGAIMAPISLAIDTTPPAVFRADHPFVFMIRDNRNGAIMFMGRITNPDE